jgi:hypothetical protein
MNHLYALQLQLQGPKKQHTNTRTKGQTTWQLVSNSSKQQQQNNKQERNSYSQ